MPIYEYRCDKCGSVLEILQPMDAAAVSHCREQCVSAGKPGDGRLRRMLSASRVHSRGGSNPGRRDAGLPACGRCGMRGGPCAMS
ncbi:MAG: zinc ribbon domain-containing protein [Planctomycetes bacterium]|nr:zinc ribbon domain-containing protein [Planctomycetota bacterium]